MNNKATLNFIEGRLNEDGYDGVFEKLDTFDYDKFQSFILHYCDKNTAIIIEPTKDQLLILKNLFNNKFSKQEPIKILQSIVISSFKDYMSTCYPTATQSYIYESMLDMVLITREKAEFKIFDKHVTSSSVIGDIIETNLHSIDNSIILMIIEKLFGYIKKNIKVDEKSITVDTFKMVFIIVTLILKLKENYQLNNTTDEIKIEKEFIKFLRSPSFFAFFTNYISAGTTNSFANQSLYHDFKYLNFGANSGENSISKQITDYILESCSTLKEHDYNTLRLLFLSVQSKTNSYLYQKKFKTEISSAMEQFLVSEYCENKLEPTKLISLMKIISILLENGQFEFGLVKRVRLHYLKPTSLGLHTFCGLLTFDIALKIISILYNDKMVTIGKIKSFVNHGIVEFFINGNEDRRLIKSAFKINELEFINVLKQDEYKLLEIYDIFFEKITESIDIESILPNLFYNLENSPTKLEFIKSKLYYLIQVVNFNEINNWILPHFKEKCEKSPVYQLKLSGKVQGQKDAVEGTPPLSNVLVQEIILRLAENPVTTMYQKLQLSLVSKRIFDIVQGFMNSSTSVPIILSDISFDFNNHFYRGGHDIGSSRSLFRSDLVKYVKISFESNKPKKHSSWFRLLMSSCKSIEILDFSNMAIHKEYPKFLSYLCWYKNIKKLIIFSDLDVYESVKLEKSIKTLLAAKQEKIQVIIKIDTYAGPGSEEVKSDFSKFDSVSIPIDEYLKHSSFKKNGFSGVPHLELAIAEYIDNSQLLMYFRKHANYQDDSFDNLRTLSIEISPITLFYDFYLNFFKFFKNKSNNIQQVNIIINTEKPFNVKTSLEMLFKILSLPSSVIGFNNLKQITISDYYFIHLKHWKNINSFSFNQKVFNTTTFTSIEFIKDQEKSNIINMLAKDDHGDDKNNGGDDEDTSSINSEDFNTDESFDYDSEDEDEDEDENELDEDEEYDDEDDETEYSD